MCEVDERFAIGVENSLAAFFLRKLLNLILGIHNLILVEPLQVQLRVETR